MTSELSDAKRALLALRLRQRRAARATAERPWRRDGAGPFPLSFAQQRLWLLDQINPGLIAYNAARVLRLRGPLDVPALRAALDGLVVRHAALRTRYGTDDGEPVQWLGAPYPVDLATVDAAGEAAARELVTEQLRVPFDLAAGRLLRARLIRLGEHDHILAMVVHHIASDEGSKALTYTDLGAFYRAALAGRAPDTTPPPLRYADYAAWERDQVRAELTRERLAWWRRRLAGAPAQVELPTDRRRPAAASYTGARHQDVVDRATVDGLRAVAERHGATLFMVLVAGYAALLGRYCGQDDLVLAVPTSARPEPECADVVGMFGNNLVLRLALDGEPTFATLVDRVRVALVDALANEVPFDLLVREAGHDPARPPLTGVLCTLLADPGAAAPWLDGLSVTPVDVDPGTAKLDLSLTAAVRPDGLRLTWEYSTDLLDGALVAQLSTHLGRLLAGAVTAPHTPVGDLPLLSAGERAAATDELVVTAAAVPTRTLPALLADAAAAHPDRTAVRSGATTLTYRALHERANGIAALLADTGLPAGATVAVRLHRCADLVAAPLGVLRAGCRYLPLDPDAPSARTAYLLADAGADAVLVDEPVALPGSVPQVRIDGATPAPDGPDRAPAPGDAAYLIYTSGSTGNPKGVAVTHANLVNLLTGMGRAPGLAATDTLLAVTTFAFDVAALELFGPLLVGATVVVAADGVLTDPAALGALLDSSGATVMQATPAVWRMLHDSGWRGSTRFRAWSGGEALPGTLATALLGHVGEVWNLYGPTEATIAATSWRATGDAGELTVPIGLPTANTACYVLDAAGRPVPRGVAGELCIGGAGVASGYHERPELTAEKFQADPFTPGGRMYRTGDRVRRRGDGALVYLGRTDDQVKLRGLRIELGEIEAVLARHPAVREAAVLLRAEGADEPRLIAYVSGDVPAGRLRAFAAETLPRAMIPAQFVAVDPMPRTQNGKLDRAALPHPAAIAGTAGTSPPDGPTEHALAAIWAEVLGAERIGREDEFFALGGHSLAAARIAARVRSRLGVRLPVRAVFDAPTVAALARTVDADSADHTDHAEHIDAGVTARWPVLAAAPEGQREFPASSQQRRMWFLDRLQAGAALYTAPECMAVDGPLDVAALRAGLDELAVRHPVLRTTLPERDGEPVQVIGPPSGFPLEQATAADEAAAHRMLREAARQPFDLAAGPLIRAVLVQVHPRRHLLALIAHHVLVDAWSLRVLSGELGTLLAGRTPAPPGPVHYGDYATWQQRWLAGPAVTTELHWWRDRLAGAPTELELPTDRPRPTAATQAGRRHVQLLEPGLLAALDRVAAAASATRFMVLCTATMVLLARYGGQRDIVVGTPVAGRPLPELESVVGPFANTLVLRAALDPDDGFGAALATVRQATLAALAHQDLPFEHLVAELAVDRDLAHNPLFGVLVTMQDDQQPLPPIPGATVEPVDVDRGVARFDLSLSFAARADGLRVAWEYSTELFDDTTVARFAGHLRCLLTAATAQPATPLARLALLPSTELRALDAANPPATPMPQTPVHDLVAVRAAATPDAPAVTCAGRELSYAELDRRADRLADALAAAGARRGTLVGLGLDRSVDLIVGMQAVLRTGAAYLPLDPDYPRARVEYMLAHSRAALLLTRTDLRARLDNGTLPVLCLDDLPAPGAARPERDRAGLDDLAYVIYTSGSTGRPKGVMIEHRALVNLLTSMAEHPGLRPGETMLGLTTPAFDLSVPDLYLPLVQGARLALATAEQATDPRRLAGLLRDTGATLMQATPATWRMLFEDGWSPERPLRAVVGGDVVPGDLAARLATVTEQAWNFYGPTETCVWSTRWRLTASAGSTVPIGTPLANTVCYVVDDQGNRVPFGVAGELWIGGAGVARGYLGDTAAAAFGADPFRAGGRVYRTGDRVLLRPDGVLTFVGRRDQQVKLRGFRVELGEITSALTGHPDVREAVVIIREDRPGDQRLVAYVVTERPVRTDALLEHLAQTLPGYMLPGAVVELDRLPLTPNAKLDRSALPAPGAGGVPSTTVTGPRTPVEERLVALWAEVLGRSDIGVHDNLFHRGAHSLLVTRVLARLRDTLGAEVPLRRAYEAPTVAHLATEVVVALAGGEPAPAHDPAPDRDAALRDRIGGLNLGKRALLEKRLLRREPGTAAPEAIPRRRGDGPVPLSSPQQRLWFLDQLAPGQPTYNAGLGMRVRGALDVDRLQRALRVVIDRHEALRTVFRTGEDLTASQVVLDRWRFDVATEDLRTVPEGERERQMLEHLRTESRRGFDLTADLMLRVSVLRLAEDEHVLLFVVHHIAFDGWSTGKLWHELAELYAADREGRPAELPTLPIQYADWSVWQQERLRGAELERLQRFWRAALDGAPALLELPTDHPRPPVQTFSGAHQPFDFPDVPAQRVRELAGAQAATPFMVLVAACAAALDRWSGQQDLVFGSPIAGRDRPELNDLMGLFANTFVVRVRTDGAPTLRELVDRTRDAALGSYEHQEMPFEKLVETIAPRRDPRWNPIFQVNVRVRAHATAKFALPGVTIEPFDFDIGFSRFDLAFALNLDGEHVGGYVEYNEALFEGRTIRQLIGRLGRLVADGLARPDSPIGDLRWHAEAGATPIRRRRR